MNQVIKPSIPYRGPISGGLHEGKKIVIAGHVPYGADRFTVNLQTSQDPSSDRPLHISVRFDDGNTIVRNTRQKGCYGSEERSGPFPFALGLSFSMRICVERTGYKISVNGQHCCNYAHRLPFTRVTSMFIEGDVDIDEIDYINVIPTQHPAVYNPPANPVYASTPGYVTPLPCLPCTFPIYGGIRPGMSIHITARPSANPQRFAINLQNGASTYSPPEIAFQFDARFYSNIIARNSRIGNVWGLEEVMISYFPFRPGQNFDMTIRVQGDCYMVNVNGQHFVTFRHRLHDFARIDTLYIENDIIVSSIRYT